MAVPLFTQNTSIHNTFNRNNDISIVCGHLTHWSAPPSAIYDRIRNCLGSAHEPETDLHRNSRWGCVYVYVCVLGRRRVCTLDDLWRGEQSSGKRAKVCVAAGPQDAACGESVRMELGSAGTMTALRALTGTLWERECTGQGMTGRLKAFRHKDTTIGLSFFLKLCWNCIFKQPNFQNFPRLPTKKDYHFFQ